MSVKIEPWTVESDVPMPKLGVPPLELLEVGESILFPLTKRGSVQTTASRIKRESGKEYSVKKVDDDHCRVWRIK